MPISQASVLYSALRAHQPEAINPVVHFWLAEFDQSKYDALPKYYREKIAESSEWRGQKAKEENKVTIEDSDLSDIPF